ncbi:hypothetical protein M3Y96_00130000 [Aphelenchoides besseyi]|nr:hypothetical protein M3Y96_00130000 [Aphelenchoides besseyi]
MIGTVFKNGIFESHRQGLWFIFGCQEGESVAIQRKLLAESDRLLIDLDFGCNNQIIALSYLPNTKPTDKHPTSIPKIENMFRRRKRALVPFLNVTDDNNRIGQKLNKPRKPLVITLSSDSEVDDEKDVENKKNSPTKIAMDASPNGLQPSSSMAFEPKS